MKIRSVDRLRMTDDDGSDIRMEPGDQLTVGPKAGQLACEMGWAEDVDGVVPTGERRTGPVTLTPENVVVEPGELTAKR